MVLVVCEGYDPSKGVGAFPFPHQSSTTKCFGSKNQGIYVEMGEATSSLKRKSPESA